MKRFAFLWIIPSALLLMVIMSRLYVFAQDVPDPLLPNSLYMPLAMTEGGSAPTPTPISGPILVRVEDQPHGVSQEPDSFCLSPDGQVTTSSLTQACILGGDYTGNQRPSQGVQLPFSQLAFPVVAGQIVTVTQTTLNLANHFSASTQLTNLGPDQYRRDLVGVVISDTKAPSLTGLFNGYALMGIAQINEAAVLAAGESQVLPTLKQQLDYARGLEAFAKSRGGLPFSIRATDPVYNFSGVLESTYAIEAARCGLTVAPEEGVVADGNYSPGFIAPVKIMAHIRFIRSDLQDCMVNNKPYLAKLEYYSLVDLMFVKALSWQKWDTPIRGNLLPIMTSPVSTQPIGWVGALPTPPAGSGWVFAVTSGVLGAKGAITLYGYWNTSTQIFQAAYGAIFMLPGASCDSFFGKGVCYRDQNLR